MALEQSMIEQLRGVFAPLEQYYTLRVEIPEGHVKAKELLSLVEDFVSSSDRLSMDVREGSNLLLELFKNDAPTGVSFRGIPTGHEFTSLILAVYNADGKGRNYPDDVLFQRIQGLKAPIELSTYVSLTCTNCPEVVQALNLIALIGGEGVKHQMVDGALYPEEVERLGITAVPSVYANGELLHIGQSNLGELLLKLEEKVGKTERPEANPKRKTYDLVVVGAGPSGVTSAIYSARKGLRVALVAERIGGQVKETTAIENITSVIQTTGTQLAADLRKHAEAYEIDILDQRHVEKITIVSDGVKEVWTSLGEIIVAPQVIIATGAAWRRLGVPGEAEHIGKGVAFCPHCDGPFFRGKDIAVIGGGNSGIEAAIDLAGICKSVTVLEFADELKADVVLQDKLLSLSNTRVLTGIATQEILGDGSKITGLIAASRHGGDPYTIDVDGVFVQIGLAANTHSFSGLVECNHIGEIIIDERCRTSVAGIYAAGDCTTVPYKQIVIAMGEGAKAALTAFDDRIRGGKH